MVPHEESSEGDDLLEKLKGSQRPNITRPVYGPKRPKAKPLPPTLRDSHYKSRKPIIPPRKAPKPKKDKEEDEEKKEEAKEVNQRQYQKDLLCS